MPYSIRSLPGVFLITGLVFLLVSAAAGSDIDNQWSGHPALKDFSMDEAQLPGVLYLVRTRGLLPETGEIEVHGSRGGLFVVSGEESAVMNLVEQGCGVYPLHPLVESCDSSPRNPRTWTPITVPDPVVEEMVGMVNWEGISSEIQWLVDFGTRYSLASNHSEVAGAIAGRFAGFGIAPVLHSFQYNGTTLWNIEATQQGTVYPDSFIIICGHFDSVSSDPYVSAPGADDNGTGTATVLAAAEILTDYSFEYSIRYICFSGEEQGLRGSQAYAAWAASIGMGIVGVLNFDMLGYWEPGVEQDLEIETDEPSQWLAQAVLNAANLYTDTPYELHVYGGAWWGDHASFWGEGFSAVNNEEAWDWGDPDFNPYYHTTSDLLQYIGEEFMVGNVQLGVAALATLAVPDLGGTGTGSASSSALPVLSLSGRPNPFRIQIELSVTGSASLETATVVIHDLQGRHVDTVEMNLSNGQGYAVWAPGERVHSGVYFARVDESNSSEVLRMLHLE